MECLFFSKTQYVRVLRDQEGPGHVEPGYPKPLASLGWGSFGLNGIDAALDSGSVVYLFSGAEYVRITLTPEGLGPIDPGYPKPISAWGWGSFGSKGIDAALKSGPVCYFFSGDQYIRVKRGDTGPGTVDPGYPQPLSVWNWGDFGAKGIDAALPSGPVCYFFSGDQYIRVTRGDLGPGTVDPGYPQPISVWNWGSFGREGIRAALRLDTVPARPVVDPAPQMMDLFRRTGGKFGRLGSLVHPATRDPDGGWTQRHALGSIHADASGGNLQAQSWYRADVDIAVVKCFGTFSDHGDDTTYAVVSLVCVDPNNVGGQTVVTQRTVIQNDVGSGAQIFKNVELPQVDLTGSGLLIHTAIWRHVDGNADDIRDKIHSVLNDAVNKTAAAIAGIAGDPSITAGSVGSITDWSVGGIKPIDWATLGLANLIAGFFADKLIDEHSYWIPQANMEAFADQQTFANSIRDPSSMGLDFDVQANWPPQPNDEYLFSGGGGSYKIWFAVRTIKSTEPVFPNLK